MVSQHRFATQSRAAEVQLMKVQYLKMIVWRVVVLNVRNGQSVPMSEDAERTPTRAQPSPTRPSPNVTSDHVDSHDAQARLYTITRSSGRGGI